MPVCVCVCVHAHMIRMRALIRGHRSLLMLSTCLLGVSSGCHVRCTQHPDLPGLNHVFLLRVMFYSVQTHVTPPRALHSPSGREGDRRTCIHSRMHLRNIASHRIARSASHGTSPLAFPSLASGQKHEAKRLQGPLKAPHENRSLEKGLDGRQCCLALGRVE